MTEVLVHFAVPFASLRSVGVDWRKALFVSVVALTPDLDVLFRTHRSMSHSILMLAVVVVPILSFSLATKRTAVTRVVLLGTIGVISHLVLDLFGEYTPLLWPLTDQSVRIIARLDVHFESTPSFIVSAALLTKQMQMSSFQVLDGSLITTGGLAISLILLAPSIVEIIRKQFARRSSSS